MFKTVTYKPLTHSTTGEQKVNDLVKQGYKVFSVVRLSDFYITVSLINDDSMIS